MSKLLHAFVLMLAFAATAHADGYISLSNGQNATIDYQTLGNYGGRVQVSCYGYNPGPGPGPGYPPPPPPPPRDCNRYVWAYNVNPYKTSQYTCTANGVQVGMLRDCQQDNACGSEGALKALCYQRCQAGEFDGLLPRWGRW